MPEKNDIITLEAQDITAEGAGVGRADGMAVFVNGLIKGETAEVKIIKRLKSYAVGRIEKLVSPSPFRAEPECPVFKECGGCTHQHMSYAAQLEAKTGTVKSCLKKFSGTDASPLPCLPSPESIRYRNKISMPLRYDSGIKMGCYKKRSHEVVDAPDCLIAKKELCTAADIVREFAEKHDISIYDEGTGKGLLRHVVARTTSDGEIMLGLVINGKTLPYAEALISAVREKAPAVSTVVINENTSRGNVILGRKSTPIYGTGRIRERILDCVFDISLNTFLQVNHAQTERMYSHVLSLLGDDAGVVCDLYCGAGTITLNAARAAKKIYGAEIVPQAVEDAKRNAAINRIENAEFLCADCEKALPEIIKKEGKLDAVIVDPPRKGLSPSVISGIAKSGAARVIYVSCDPATLSRDLGIFTGYGYSAKSVQPFDMFPMTGHVETVCCLYHQKKDFISVPYEPKDAEYLKKVKKD